MNTAVKRPLTRPVALRRAQPVVPRALPSYASKKVLTPEKAFVGRPSVRTWKPLGLPQLPSRPSASAGNVGGQGSIEPKKYFGETKDTWFKIVPLCLMFFSILFNYTILRDTKDVLVVTAPGSGAEIIPFLKTWVNLPMAVIFTVGYAQLANMVNQQTLFFTCVVPFVAFFGAFAFVMYPARDWLHPTQFCIDLVEKWGERWSGPIAIVRNWTFCLFYVMAELWGSVVVSVCFWGLANTICTVEEGKRFYPIFGLIANVALIFSGQAVRHYSDVRATLPAGVDGWGVSLRGMMTLVVAFGAVICALRIFIEKTTVERMEGALPVKKKKEKPNMSVGESFVFLLKSSYIRAMATLVVCYGIAINLVEVTWKSKLKQQYPDPNDYSVFMGNFSTCTGSLTFILMLLARFVVFPKFGWGVAAQLTPAILFITGTLFFALVIFSEQLTPTLAGLGFTPLFAAVIIGAAQNIFSKGAKYSLFDPCKEMAYIPLDEEVRTKGKAAIDVICNPLGKSGGATIQQVMILGFGSLAASTPYLGIILGGIIFAWFRAAAVLDGEFKALTDQRDAEKAALQSGKTGPSTGTAAA